MVDVPGFGDRDAGLPGQLDDDLAGDPVERAGADECARYLENKKDYLGYATALGNGWPIATGIIEGACRHIPVN